MTKGILLFCFDTSDTQYHKILQRSIPLLQKNLQLEITVVTDIDTFKKMPHLGRINYKLIEPQTGNQKLHKEWKNLDRCDAYDLSPYDQTLVLDIDYFCFTDNLLQVFDTNYNFLIPTEAHDVSGRKSMDHRKRSLIPMVWATVFYFKKGKESKTIFQTIKYVKSYYAHFVDLYRITARNFRNDYAFAIALKQLNGFKKFNTMPYTLATLPADCKVVEMNDKGIGYTWLNNYNFVINQDVHVLDKESINV